MTAVAVMLSLKPEGGGITFHAFLLLWPWPWPVTIIYWVGLSGWLKEVPGNAT